MSQLSQDFGGLATSIAPVTETESIVMGPIDVQGYQNLGFYVENTLATGDDILLVKLQSAPESAGPWIDIVDDMVEALAAEGAVHAAYTSSALKYIRLVATCAAEESTTATFWLCASQRG